MNWKPRHAFDIGAQYLYNYGKGTTDTTTGSLLTTESLPDNKYRMHNLDLYAKWKYNDNFAFRVNYIYQHMSADDWAYDNLLQWSANNVVTNGMGSGSYRKNFLMFSLAYIW